MIGKKVAGRFALLLTSLIATLLASDFAISIVSNARSEDDAVEVGDGASSFMTHHSALGWIPRSNHTIESRDAQGKIFELQFDSNSLRGASDSSSAALNILVLGDSFTLASNLPEEQTFVAIMQTELRKLGVTDAKVLNGG